MKRDQVKVRLGAFYYILDLIKREIAMLRTRLQ
jgi:hypothetical protein